MPRRNVEPDDQGAMFPAAVGGSPFSLADRRLVAAAEVTIRQLDADGRLSDVDALLVEAYLALARIAEDELCNRRRSTFAAQKVFAELRETHLALVGERVAAGPDRTTLDDFLDSLSAPPSDAPYG